ncbi:MAG TPA: phytanoyl-CoA dioxygenase family protein [Pyrinomonadaceae bacterium]|jgi:ectoine hydroxylase-related dioxygenase (phytanoyl-CoA dioxygenase family)
MPPAAVDENGFAILEQVLDTETVSHLTHELAQLKPSAATSRRNESAYGALKVIPKSHKDGRLSAVEIKSRRQANETELCSVKKGDCLIMRPLILHSSSAGTNPKSRRVIHFEFSAESLPNGLDWYGS